MPGGHAHADRARAVGGLDVERRVADHGHGRRVDRVAQHRAGALDAPPRELGAVGRVGAVAAKREVVVEVGASELDVGGRLCSAGGETEQATVGVQLLEPLADAGQHAISGRIGREYHRAAMIEFADHLQKHA